MKRIYLFIALLLLAIGCNNNNNSVISPPDYSSLNIGLIAYYPFNGNTRDSSGNYFDGSVQNDHYYINGVSSKAIYLVGDTLSGSSGGYVVIPPIDTVGLDSLSICIWVKEDTIYNPSNNPNAGEGYINFSSDNRLGWCGIGHYFGNIQIAVGSEQEDKNPQAVNPISITYNPSDTHRWVFYSLVYNNGLLSAYKNGVFITSINQRLMIYGKAGFIGFHEWGGVYPGNSTRFSGAIDELRIYKRALSSQEIQELYQMR